eukprot:8991955-Heterocapsa_arctica.AAC.1
MCGRVFRGLFDEGAFEAQNRPLEIRSCAKRSASSQEFNGDSQDVRTRKRACLIRTNAANNINQSPP